MKIELRKLGLPDFGIPVEKPHIPSKVYEERCQRAYDAARCDWLVVYGDREH